jgi:SSS family solute:Na+ symporter
MTLLDWAIVVGLNLLVIVYGINRSRKTKTSEDWFLAGRSLPFWVVGLSMFATSIDGGDYIATNGQSYKDGMSMLSIWWLATIGAIVAAWFVIPPMCRARMFTNAEYLEARFGPAARIISVLVQLQYRGNILAQIAISLHIAFMVLGAISSDVAWSLVVAFAIATTIYAAWGGLKTIAVTDVFLSVIMIAAALVLWTVLWQNVGGWAGVERRVAAQESAAAARQLLHIGEQGEGRSHPLVVALGWGIVGLGYFVVNHSQTMKMLGARSMWDLKMGVVVTSFATILLMYFTGTLGIIGRALLPGLERPDSVFPILVDRYLASGLKGLVVAGVVAAAVSTYEGIGAALSALFTRDIYARLMVKDSSDRHYLIVSRVATLVLVALSFAYVPFILRERTMVDFFLNITSVFVTPLMTVYLMGVFTRVHRRSGFVGLIVGPAYGLARLWFGGDADTPGLLPFWLTETFAAYLWSVAITTAAMLSTSLIFGWEKNRDLIQKESGGWAKRSQEAVPPMPPSPFPGHVIPFWANPNAWAGLVLTVSLGLVFYVFW